MTAEKDIIDYYYPDFLFEYYDKVIKVKGFENFFLSKNINDEPSQTYIFLFLLHRKLNTKVFNLKELLLLVKNRNLGAKSCGKQKINNSVSNFKNLKVGENLNLYFSVRINDGIASTVYLDCPTLNWNFDNSKDLILNGDLVNKFYITHGGVSKEFIIKFKIREINRKNVLYFFKNIDKNDTIEVNLNSYGLKI